MNRYLQLIRRQDWLLFTAMVLLAIGSVFFVYSASYRGPGEPMPDFYRMQMIWFGLGAVVYLAAALIDYRLICQWATLWYVVAVAALLLVLAAGTRVHGSKAWLGWGGLGIQPAEFAKLAVIVGIAYYLFHRTPELRRHWSTIGGALVLVAIPLVLILAQPDLGSALVLVPICYGLCFVAGARVKHLVLVTLIGVLLTPVAWTQLKDYQNHG